MACYRGLSLMSQAKIELEAQAGRLLRNMAAYGWYRTIEMDAAQWLIRRGFAYWSGQDLFMTIEGREYYQGLCKNPSVTESTAAWKAEVLSGMASEPGPVGTRTKQSSIDRAVIPKPAGPGSPKSPEDLARQNEQAASLRRDIMARVGCTGDEFVAYVRENRLRWCEGCETIGVFDRKGGGFQHRCRKCTKERR